MVTMEADGIKVECETPAACVRALKREQTRRETARSVAYDRSYANLGRIVASAPNFHAIGQKLTDAQFANVATRDRDAFTERWNVRAWSADGEVSVEFYGMRVTAVWERANGEITLIETDEDGRPGVYIVGIADGQYALMDVPQFVRDAILRAPD